MCFSERICQLIHSLFNIPACGIYSVVETKINQFCAKSLLNQLNLGDRFTSQFDRIGFCLDRFIPISQNPKWIIPSIVKKIIAMEFISILIICAEVVVMCNEKSHAQSPNHQFWFV